MCFKRVIRFFPLFFCLYYAQITHGDVLIDTNPVIQQGLLPVKTNFFFRPNSSFLSIKGNQFQVLKTQTVDEDDIQLGILGISPAVKDKHMVVYAPVKLPYGAKVKRMISRVLDNDPVADITVELVKAHSHYDLSFIHYQTFLHMRSITAGRFLNLQDKFITPVEYYPSPERWFVVVSFDSATKTPIHSNFRVSWVSIEYDSK